jgi:hypothetical protein
VFILLTYNGGWSSYNAMAARFEKRFSNGFYMLSSYTWQKALDLGATDDLSAISVDFKSVIRVEADSTCPPLCL